MPVWVLVVGGIVAILLLAFVALVIWAYPRDNSF